MRHPCLHVLFLLVSRRLVSESKALKLFWVAEGSIRDLKNSSSELEILQLNWSYLLHYRTLLQGVLEAIAMGVSLFNGRGVGFGTTDCTPPGLCELLPSFSSLTSWTTASFNSCCEKFWVFVITFIVGVFTLLNHISENWRICGFHGRVWHWVRIWSWLGFRRYKFLFTMSPNFQYFVNGECLSCVFKISMPSWLRSSVRQMVLKPSLFKNSVNLLRSLEF